MRLRWLTVLPVLFAWSAAAADLDGARRELSPAGKVRIGVIDQNPVIVVKDKATGKEQSIVIKASSGLSDEEIEQMIRDAEAHSEEDKKFEEMVTLRNQADGLIHGARKAVEDAGDKATDEEKIAIEAAAADLEEALKGDDKDAIEEKTKVLSEASAELAQKMYAEQAQAAGDGAENAPDGDAVDAEFEEVKDDKEQKQ